MEPELVVDAQAALGEGPVWDAATNRLVWVDIYPGRVHSFDPATGANTYQEAGQQVGAVAPRAQGGLALAAADGFFALDPDGTVSTLAEVEAGNPSMRMNDGNCDARGRFWAGTTELDHVADAGSLYRLDPDRSVRPTLHGVSVSNGIVWSLDDSLMYFIDTPTGGVDVFDFDLDEGAVANRRRFATMPPEGNMPDGMTIDAEGCLWVAAWGSWHIYRFTPEGALDRAIRLPASQLTSCAFGGPDLDELYVTSARARLSDAELREQPHAGGLFRLRPGVSGRPTFAYAG